MPESMRGLPAAAGAALLLGLAALLRGRAAEAPRGFVQAVWAPQASPASLGASRPRPWAAPAEAPSPRACGPAAGAALGAAALAAAAAGLARRIPVGDHRAAGEQDRAQAGSGHPVVRPARPA
ncbi:unnamed protein product [Prorocentrum cordatum]|uniref:Uncharacterized protein n=1 Tax=Prorocentrum cordatum TaxID=2364126 RepID=A0ABN9TIB1_9DINO|nr:unnamed protein product [Polarella glacialis]